MLPHQIVEHLNHIGSAQVETDLQDRVAFRLGSLRAGKGYPPPGTSLPKTPMSPRWPRPATADSKPALSVVPGAGQSRNDVFATCPEEFVTTVANTGSGKGAAHAFTGPSIDVHTTKGMSNDEHWGHRVVGCAARGSVGRGSDAQPGARHEIYNDLFVNSVHYYLDLTRNADRYQNHADFDVHRNILLFSWKTTTNGSGIYVRPYTNVRAGKNILAFGDIYAVKNQFYAKKVDERGIPQTGLANENVQMDYNLMYIWQRGLYGWVLEGQSGILSPVWLQDLEDTSLASAEWNEVGDPGLAYNKEWIRLFVNREDAASGEVTGDTLNQLLQCLDLPLQASAGMNRQGYAMRSCCTGGSGAVRTKHESEQYPQKVYRARE